MCIRDRPMTNPRIVDVDRNAHTKIIITLEVGQTLTVNTKYGTVTDDEGNDLSGLVTDDSVFILFGGGTYPIFTADEQPENVLYYPKGTMEMEYYNTLV